MASETPSVGASGETVGCWRIALGSGVDPADFEAAWEATAGTRAPVGHQTRGGIVTAEYLLKDETDSSPLYHWMVHWLEQGGSPFGSAGAPRDPAELVDGLSLETSFSRYRVL